MDDLTALGTGSGILMPLVTAITAFIMKVTPEKFSKTKFAPWVSLVSGIIASAIWQLMNPNISWFWAIARGVIIGFGGSALWDKYKSVQAMRDSDG